MSRLMIRIAAVAALCLTAHSEASEVRWIPCWSFMDTRGAASACPDVEETCGVAPRWTLIVWTTPTCGPCRQFWQDLSSDAAFREAICARFSVQWADVEAHRADADAHGIRALPTFDLGDRHVVGYQGKRWLWRQLTTAVPANSKSFPPPTDVTEAVEEQGPASTVHPMVPLPSLPRARRSVAESVSEGALPAPTLPQASWHGPEPRDRENAGKPRATLLRRLGETVRRSAPLVLTGLELVGVLGGTAASGGLGTLALAALWGLLKRRRLGKTSRLGSATVDLGAPSPGEEAERAILRAPFPRRLDEARELLALRQSEGRVATLDALRGMFLDDELNKLATSPNEQDASVANRLKTALDARINEVAPLSTTID